MPKTPLEMPTIPVITLSIAQSQDLWNGFAKEFKALPQAKFISEPLAKSWLKRTYITCAESIMREGGLIRVADKEEAYKLPDHQEVKKRVFWHVRRLAAIGGSDIGALLGDEGETFSNPHNLSKEKLCIFNPQAPNHHMMRGSRAEPFLRDIFRSFVTEQTKGAAVFLEDLPLPVYGKVDEYPFLSGNLDEMCGVPSADGKKLFVTIMDYKAPLDAKRSLEHGIAVGYKAQLHSYYFITQEKISLYNQNRKDSEPELVLNKDMRLLSMDYTNFQIVSSLVPFDDAFGEKLLARAIEFWNGVCNGIIPPPPLTEAETLPSAFDIANNNKKGLIKGAPDGLPEGVIGDLEKLETLKALLKANEAEVEACRDRIEIAFVAAGVPPVKLHGRVGKLGFESKQINSPELIAELLSLIDQAPKGDEYLSEMGGVKYDFNQDAVLKLIYKHEKDTPVDQFLKGIKYPIEGLVKTAEELGIDLSHLNLTKQVLSYDLSISKACKERREEVGNVLADFFADDENIRDIWRMDEGEDFYNLTPSSAPPPSEEAVSPKAKTTKAKPRKEKIKPVEPEPDLVEPVELTL